MNSVTTIDVAAAASGLASRRLREVCEAELRRHGSTSVSTFVFHGLFQERRRTPGLTYAVGQPVYHQPSLRENDAYPPFFLQTDIDYSNPGDTADSFKVPVNATRRTAIDHVDLCQTLPHLLTSDENRWMLRGVVRGAIGHRIQVKKDFFPLLPDGGFAAQSTHSELEIRF